MTATASDPVVIVDGARTPMGSFQGSLKDITATALGAVAIEGALKRSGVAGEDIDEVIMGCVLPAGLGQAPARQAAHGAGIPWDAGCTTVNKMCGSGMKATMLAHDLIVAGVNEVMVAGGLESMTNAPYLMDKARGGLRMGHGQVWDHMFLDGLEDAYEPGRLMGAYAEDAAQHYQFTREAQDDFAITSLMRAKAANEDGSFDRETEPVTVQTRKGEVTVERDEQPFNADLAKIPKLKPAFRKEGTVTPANSSSISDGATALVLTTQSEAEQRGLSPRARIVAHATHAQDPAWLSGALCADFTAPRPRSARSRRCWRRPAGRPAMSTCSRSTRPSPSSPWWRCGISACRTTSSTSMAAPAPSATRSARRARALSSPC